MHLVKRPPHKPINRREEFSPEDKRMAAPLGMEDKNSFMNIPLICTLRKVDSKFDFQTKSGNKEKTFERSNSGTSSAFKNSLPQEPSFYHDDVTRYHSRFDKHITER